SRCVRRAKQSVYFRVYLVAVRSPWQAKCAFSCLSCRGAFAAPSKACIFAFILSRCVFCGEQRVNFSVCLVAVRTAPRRMPIRRRVFVFIFSRCVRRSQYRVYFGVYLVAVRPPWQAERAL